MSKITHEEIKKVLIYIQATTKIKNMLLDYINQQQNKDKLLGLYQSLYRYTNDDWLFTRQQIKELEKEV